MTTQQADQKLALSRFRGQMARQRRGRARQLCDENGEPANHYFSPVVTLSAPHGVMLCDMVLTQCPDHVKARELRKGAAAADQRRPIHWHAEPCCFLLLDALNEIYPPVEEGPQSVPQDIADALAQAGEGSVPPPYDGDTPPPPAIE